MAFSIRRMEIDDYEQVDALWRATEGLGLSADDSPEGIARFLQANPGLCFVAEDGEQIAGTALCGQDGRRGYLYHLAVDSGHRRQGIGRALVEACIQALREQGIRKCHIMVYTWNEEGAAFWQNAGWELRPDLTIRSRTV